MKGYINIRENVGAGQSRFSKVFSSNSEFFQKNEQLIVKGNQEYLELSVPTLGYNAKMSKLCKVGNAKDWYNFSLMLDVPCGTHFEFDEEESNEDVKVIYFKQDD